MRPNGVHLEYAMKPGHQSAGDLSHPLFDLLSAVQTHGSIQRAASSLGDSYRHAWGALKRWESEFGRPLVSWTQGHPARLTPHATTLLAHERLLRARLTPQIGALRAEIERLFEQAAGDDSPTLAMPAVSDPALTLLRETARERQRLHLALRDTTSLDALRALVEGRAALAAFALPAPGDDDAFDAARVALRAGGFSIIVALRRTLGFILSGEPPADIAAVARGVRFAGRLPGSSSAAVWQRLCRDSGIDAPRPARIEPCHDAAAAAVAAGIADLAFGTEAAAAGAGLGFVPLAHDHLVVAVADADADAHSHAHGDTGEDTLRLLREAVADAGWRQAAGALAGVEPVAAQATLAG